MNRLLCAVSIVALTVPAVAAAQNDKHHGEQAGKPQNGGQHAARPGNSHGQTGQAQPNRPSQARPAQTPAQSSHPSHANRPGRPSTGERPTIQPAPNRPNSNRPNSNRPNSNRPGTRPTNFHPVRAAPFRYPHGYHYRRWSIGLVLPSIFLASPYFYNNWAIVGAYPPPPGFVWVRYGPDLLLVSRHSGRIRDVIYGAFY